MGPDLTVCAGESISLNACDYEPGLVYTWSTPSGSQVTNPPCEFNGVVTQSGQYCVNVYNPFNGCSYSDCVEVTVLPSPSPNLGPDQIICPGETVNLFGCVLGTPNQHSYSWSGPIGLQPFPLPCNINVTPTTSSTYCVTVTDNNNGCTATDCVTIDVHRGSTPNLGPDITLCAGEPISLNACDYEPGLVYTWTTPTGPQSTIPPCELNITPTVSGQYCVDVFNPVTGCILSDCIEVTVLPAPAANLGPDLSVCKGDQIHLVACQLSFPNQYSHSWSGPNIQPILYPAPCDIFVTPPVGQSTYCVTVRDNFTGCSSTDCVDVTVDSVALPTLPDELFVCTGELVDLNGCVPGNSTAYSWSGPNGPISPGDCKITVVPTQTSTYCLTLTNTNNGCSDEVCVTVNVLPPPAPNLGPDITSCPGQPVDLFGCVPGFPNQHSYSWSGPIGLQTYPLPCDITVSPTSDATYCVTVTDNLTGCIGTDCITVTMSAPVPDLGPDQTICSGESVTLSACGTGPGGFYWWIGPVGVQQFPPPCSVTVTPTSTTTYCVKRYDFASGCITSDCVTIYVK